MPPQQSSIIQILSSNTYYFFDNVMAFFTIWKYRHMMQLLYVVALYSIFVGDKYHSTC